jgi:hypothetical protein
MLLAYLNLSYQSFSKKWRKCKSKKKDAEDDLNMSMKRTVVLKLITFFWDRRLWSKNCLKLKSNPLEGWQFAFYETVCQKNIII